MSSAGARFVIEKKLGEGAAAEVFEATVSGEGGFSRRVAIKRLHANVKNDPAFSRMFLDEAKIASGLHHGGIVAVLDYGIVDDTPFQVLELVDGADARTLASRGKERGKPMPIAVALYIVTEVARALHYVHERGLVHRDVKPANVLVSKTADVKLADFGIAFARERQERTATGIAKGTPGYMSPEQVFGGAFDARSDVFALGCVLHALAFGESPAARPGNLERLIKGEPVELSPNVPDDVAEILRRALASLPSNRHASAAAFADETGRALAKHHEGDGKGALLAWLAAIDAPTAAAAFDALLVPNMVLEQDGDAWKLDTEHREATRSGLSSPPPPKRSRAPVLALALVAMAATTFSIVRLMDHSKPDLAAVIDAESAVTGSMQTAVTSTAPVPPPTDPITSATHEARRPLVVVSAPVASASAISNVHGTLAVRGGEYRGATIFIDNELQAHGAPHYFELPIGKHTIELRADGGSIARGTVDVGPENTPTFPRVFP